MTSSFWACKQSPMGHRHFFAAVMFPLSLQQGPFCQVVAIRYQFLLQTLVGGPRGLRSTRQNAGKIASRDLAASPYTNTMDCVGQKVSEPRNE